MTSHKTGTREEWLAARLDLLEAEKELTRRGDEVSRRRQELPWVRVDKDYRFETDGRRSAATRPACGGAATTNTTTSDRRPAPTAPALPTAKACHTRVTRRR